MAYNLIKEIENYLYRHSWAPDSTVDPVTLLRELLARHRQAQSELEKIKTDRA